MEHSNQEQDDALDYLGDTGLDAQEIKDIRREINDAFQSGGLEDTSQIKAAKSEVVFPLVVNTVIIVAAAAIIIMVFSAFNRERLQVFRNGAPIRSVEGLLLQQMRNSADESLALKDQEILEVRGKLLALEKERDITLAGLEGPEREQAEKRYRQAMDVYQEQIRILNQERQGIKEELRNRETEVLAAGPVNGAAGSRENESLLAARLELERLQKGSAGADALEKLEAQTAEEIAAYKGQIAALEESLAGAARKQNAEILALHSQIQNLEGMLAADAAQGLLLTTAYEALIKAYQTYDASAGGLPELKTFLSAVEPLNSFPNLSTKVVQLVENKRREGYREGIAQVTDVVMVALRLKDGETRRTYLKTLRRRAPSEEVGSFIDMLIKQL